MNLGLHSFLQCGHLASRSQAASLCKHNVSLLFKSSSLLYFIMETQARECLLVCVGVCGVFTCER